MADSERIQVGVAYALPDEQVIMELCVVPGATAEEAIRESGILKRFREIDLAKNNVGVFGKRVNLDTVLKDGDRVEIYRPLIADPKESRRTRAAGAP